MPVIMLSSVDLPLPDLPITATNSPRFTRRLTFFKAVNGPASVLNVLTTSRTSIKYSLPLPLPFLDLDGSKLNIGPLKTSNRLRLRGVLRIAHFAENLPHPKSSSDLATRPGSRSACNRIDQSSARNLTSG